MATIQQETVYRAVFTNAPESLVIQLPEEFRRGQIEVVIRTVAASNGTAKPATVRWTRAELEGMFGSMQGLEEVERESGFRTIEPSYDEPGS